MLIVCAILHLSSFFVKMFHVEQWQPMDRYWFRQEPGARDHSQRFDAFTSEALGLT